MILLRANVQLHEVFSRLIDTMKVNVTWTGLFAVIDNYLILQGEVRSLFFNFENRKAVTNIIDIPVKEDEIVEIGKNKVLPNILNMTLYAFGKWNSLEGVRVEQDYAMLDALFTDILKEIHVQPDFNSSNYRFYKDGIRLTYEDVIQYAIEMKPEDELKEDEENEDTLGLWHKVCWKKDLVSFVKEEVSNEERMANRLGNNFYMVGYHCPICNEKLHMVVYPQGKEQLIETEEGSVYLARAYTCSHCNRFYTPRPEKLLAEGDIYFLDFESDTKAYEDYLELLGSQGDRVSNYNFNRFAVEKKEISPKEQHESEEADVEVTGNNSIKDIDDVYDIEDIKDIEGMATSNGQKRRPSFKEPENLEELAEKIESLPQEELLRISAKIEEGFYPPKSVAWFEKNKKPLLQKQLQKGKQESVSPSTQKKIENSPVVSGAVNHSSSEKYDAKLKIFPRLSDMQTKELKSQIKNDKALSEEEKRAYFSKIQEEEQKKQFETLQRKADAGKDKNYAVLSRIIEEINAAPLTPEQKKALTEPLLLAKQERAETETKELLKGLSKKMDRKQYRALREKLKQYKEVDASSYTKEFDEAFDNAERQEIANMVNRARKISRSDYTDLLGRLDKGGFSREIKKPYEEKIIEKIAQIDKKEIDKLLPKATATFDETATAYDAIANGMFLPELKANALEMLDKRLRKLKADECEQLAQKLKDMLSGKIKDNDRIFYYPARKILIGAADADEAERFDTAITIFAADKGRYEPPIVLFDTSKNKDGREGILLSADHIFFGSRFDAGTIPIAKITNIEVKTGLLNKGLYITQKNGTKTKLHYVVENREALDFTECFNEFIAYLKEKPESRKIEYLAKEKHETICCLRCGCVYQTGNVCPKCGYKNN